MTSLSEKTHRSTSPGCLHSLAAEGLGRFEVAVPDDVPAFLLAANEALQKDLRSLARSHLEQGREQIESLLERQPERSDIMFILGKLWYDLEELSEAETWFRRILEIEPHAHVYYLLSDMMIRNRPRMSEAAQLAQLAHEALPDSVDYHLHWASTLVRTGSISRGLEEFGRVETPFDRWPSDLQRVYLWHAQYSESFSLGQINRGYRQWAERFAPLALARQHHDNLPDPRRRLRVGYISADFRCHAACSAPKLLLDGHDRSQVEVFGYGNVACPDATTEALIPKFDHYRDIWGQDARRVASLIEEDRIDILVALAGHVTDNRLDVLAYKPAPVQVDFGGISTTGMPQVEYRVSDVLYDPVETQPQYVEKCLYLPNGSPVFCPPAQSPPVGPLPALANGYWTFGSFNSYPKMSSMILKLWARILRQLPTSRLILKFAAAADETVCEHLRATFEMKGVSGDRIRFSGFLPAMEHLELLNSVDLLLDTYPYNGCITTLEGLWMGVPTVTLVGDRYAGRAGLSILTHAGLEPFVARSSTEYVQKAIAFSGQLQELALIRNSLRTMVLAGEACSPRGLARGMEKLYRQMWKTWCSTQRDLKQND